MYSWRALPVPPMMQLVQSSHTSSRYSTRMFTSALLVPPMMQLVQSQQTSSPYSTRILLAHTTCAAHDAPLQFSHALGFYSTCVLLTRTICATHDAACAISERLIPLLDPVSPGRYELRCQCCNVCSISTPRVSTRHGFSVQAQTVPPMPQLVQ